MNRNIVIEEEFSNPESRPEMESSPRVMTTPEIAMHMEARLVRDTKGEKHGSIPTHARRTAEEH